MSSTWTTEIEVAVPAPRLYKAAILDWHNLAPKIASDKIVSAVLVEGLPFSFVKERLDFLDVEKFEAKSTLLEGGGLGVHLESASTHVKVEPKAGGSVVKVTKTYKLLPGVDVAGEAEKAKAAFSGVVKGCEAYLVANPDAYN
ncbi:hypothetical protein LUZ62_044439 [Rhynchospora pubera]|uniref:Bet v I/Major latex protein domain-containing protein n=1 Tax=Rhynchospora pubera TaxID=906938 RepID=A0AAV8FR37_9POAL|nr:hypothetical protein LUZ62_044439 [Rhynchospora pubera]